MPELPLIQSAYTSYESLYAPIAIIISSLLAGTIAINISARQKAVELLQAIKTDKGVDRGLATLRIIHNDSSIEITCYAYQEKADTKEAKRIRYLLNSLEQLAAGISEQVYDENIVKRSKYTTIVNTYKRSSKFIDKVQETQPTAYQELKSLAQKWENKPLKEKGRFERTLRALRII